MRIWTYIIDEMIGGNESNINEALRIKEEPNDSIAYVNIKKLAEKSEYNNEADSSNEDISNYAIFDKDFLLRQIDLISPKIIINSKQNQRITGLYTHLPLTFKIVYKIILKNI